MSRQTGTFTQSFYARSARIMFAVLAVFLFISITLNTARADIRAAHATLVSENASFFTPGVLDGRVEAIAVDGDTVFVGGTFTQVQMALDGQIVDQPYLFAYSKSTGAIITDFDPVLNKPVLALQTTGEGTGIFAGGEFTIVNGETNRKGLVKLDDFGDRVSGFSARPDKRVYAMDRSGNTLYIGGNFEKISSVPVDALAAVDTVTGALLPNIDLTFDGPVAGSGGVAFKSIDIIEVTSDNQYMVVVGNFTTINGLDRSRLALLELGSPTLVSSWNTNVFDTNCYVAKFPQYINGLDIAPDDSYFVTGSTGGYRVGDGAACDSILRFELDDLTDTDAQPTWQNFTGRDSVYEVLATEHAVYTGGHFRWLNNGYGLDRAGPGAIERRGLAALDPLNGLPLVNWRADRNPRGVGVFSLEAQPEGLYIGDDTDFLNGFNHPKLKFLPLSSNTVARPNVPSLPASILSFNAGALSTTDFDGTTMGTPLAISSVGWASARGAMMLDGQLFHADDNGDMWVSALLDDNTFALPTPVDLRGLTSNQWDLPQLSGMFFDHERSRVYYSLQNDPNLYWRAFTPDGQIFGDLEFIAENQADIPWNNVRGMDVIDGKLYFGSNDGSLYRATIVDGSTPISGTTELVSASGVNGLIWDQPLLAFSTGTVLPPNQAEFEFESVGSSAFKSFQKFEFPVQAGEPVDVRLTWDDSNAQLNVFLRDANNQLVDADNNPSDETQKWLSAPAGSGGIYTIAVKISEGSTAFTVSVNPSEEPPTPLADFEFSSNGTANIASWQVFKFDVVAGETVDAQIIWDDPNAEVNVFLRDETNTSVDSDTDGGGSPGILSAIAASSGQWSVAVKIKSGATNYDVLVDTD